MPRPSADPRKRTEWLCTCRRYGSRGKYLTRAAWYRHNPGGIKAMYGPLSDKANRKIDEVLARFCSGREKSKRPSHQELEEPPHISRRTAGSSSNVRFSAEGINGCRTYPEILQSFPRTPSPEPEPEDHPPPPATLTGQAPRPPSPELEYLDEEVHLTPTRPPTSDELDNVEPESNKKSHKAEAPQQKDATPGKVLCYNEWMVANETATEGDFEEYWKTRSRHEKVKCTNHAKKLASTSEQDPPN